ncbi:hypothetical protein BaRGS_00033661, partial [Batillaria attramentaria]
VRCRAAEFASHEAGQRRNVARAEDCEKTGLYDSLKELARWPEVFNGTPCRTNLQKNASDVSRCVIFQASRAVICLTRATERAGPSVSVVLSFVSTSTSLCGHAGENECSFSGRLLLRL